MIKGPHRERRRYPRIGNRGSVHARAYASGEGSFSASCRVKDLSPRGIRLSSRLALPVDTGIKLRVSVDDPPSTFVHKVCVRWMQPHEQGGCECGVEFCPPAGSFLEGWEDVFEVLARNERSNCLPLPLP